VLLACNAVEALKLLLTNSGRIDVVVSDVAIPLVGGFPQNVFKHSGGRGRRSTHALRLYRALDR
jgi:hypothetical protein